MIHKTKSLRACAAALAIALCTSSRSQAAGETVGDIRVSADGAGPTHLFWLQGPAAGSGGSDIVGVVDPLFAAVRFYRIERRGAGQPLASRLTSLGACGLPISFRPWRLHQTDQGVVLEGMPNPGDAGHKTRLESLSTDYFVIPRTAATSLSLSPEATVASAQWDPAAAAPCGKFDGPRAPLLPRQPYVATRGAKNPARTIILQNRKAALSPTTPLIVRAPKDGLFRLYSARELEPAGARRIVQITEGQPGSDGVLRVRQRILTYAQGAVVAQRTFDESLVRSKIGQRPLAVTPAGELLAMGLTRTEKGYSFRILSCGQVDVAARDATAKLCEGSQDEVTGRNIPDQVPVPQLADQAGGPSQAAAALTADDIFANTARVRDVTWEADASRLPERCRIASGCSAGGETFVPIRGLRLSRGIYKQRGMAYAQTSRPSFDIGAFLVQREEGWSKSLADPFTPGSHTPGNLDDGFGRDLGIDCSALVQLAWGAVDLDGRLSTDALQNAPPAYVCPDRLPGPTGLRPGDAVAINIEQGPHHVVLFAAALAIDGASDGWLVLESASGCDGVCWSIYDPAFFNGWGLYRANGRRDYPCPPHNPEVTGIRKRPLPGSFDGWRGALLRPEEWRAKE